MAQPTKACKTCPFSRQCPSGALGGSRIAVYVGQAIGPFGLPCHSMKDYQGNHEVTCPGNGRECAGASVFRANIRPMVYPHLGNLLQLPAGSDSNVFTSLVEFIRHHAPAFPEDMVQLIVAKRIVFFRRQFGRAAKGIKP